MSIQESDEVSSRRAARRVRKCLSCIDPPVVIAFRTGRPTPLLTSEVVATDPRLIAQGLYGTTAAVSTAHRHRGRYRETGPRVSMSESVAFRRVVTGRNDMYASPRRGDEYRAPIVIASPKGETDSEICRRHAALCLANTVLIIGKLLTWRDRYSPRSLP